MKCLDDAIAYSCTVERVMEIQTRLKGFARGKCLPYLMELPKFSSYIDRLSFILVGSVATGICDETSDIDIAIACDENVYSIVSKDTLWSKRRPTEVQFDGVQLHYYAVAFEEIQQKIEELDDVYLSLKELHEN